MSVIPRARIYCHIFFFFLVRPPPSSTLFPYMTLFRSTVVGREVVLTGEAGCNRLVGGALVVSRSVLASIAARSEEHTSELQSRFDLVCRLLLEKKKKDSSDHVAHEHDGVSGRE